MVIHLKHLIITFFYVHSLPNNEISFFSKLKNIIPDQQHFTTRLLLFGSELLDKGNNTFIFQYVHEYLKKLDDLRICAKISNNEFIYFIII